VAIAELEKKAPRVARLLEESGEEILGVYVLPEAHQSGCARPICWSGRIRSLNVGRDGAGFSA